MQTNYFLRKGLTVGIIILLGMNMSPIVNKIQGKKSDSITSTGSQAFHIFKTRYTLEPIKKLDTNLLTTSQPNDNITIYIFPYYPTPDDFNNSTERSFGWGFFVGVINNWTEPIWIVYQIDYYTLSGKPLEANRFVFEFPFFLPPNNRTWSFTSILALRPCRVTITVEAGYVKVVSRSGFAFLFKVFFPKES